MFVFDNSYARLPERFHARVTPTKVRAPRLLRVNCDLAELLGVDPAWLASEEGVQVLAGNAVPAGAEPIALAYAGHQFGSFVPRLGDGRAILLGEVVGTDGQRRDIQLKGSGRTPFSRGGDGRAALGPVLREYIVSEAMAALGIPTTRALAAVTTGDPVHRDEVLPGAVLTRVAASHIRVGTFEYFAQRDDAEGLTILVAHALMRHRPDAVAAPNQAVALLEHVAEVQARLVARWMGVGFIHGVMNTDNSSISGETIDYGPCAFLDEYDPKKRFSSIDHGGRYAFANQPRIAQWNLARLAEAVLPLLAEDQEEAVRLATDVVKGFAGRFEAEHLAVLRAKLGLATSQDGDRELADDLLERLASNGVDHTLFFRHLSASAADAAADRDAAALFDHEGAFHSWAVLWRRRLEGEPAPAAERAAAMRRSNPAFIPRNHRVEEAIAAARQGELGPFERMVEVLAKPFEDQPEHAALATPPSPDERVLATFCGT